MCTNAPLPAGNDDNGDDNDDDDDDDVNDDEHDDDEGDTMRRPSDNCIVPSSIRPFNTATTSTGALSCMLLKKKEG
jgi:hypothetical protein